jgi:tRNA (Thr-GGU) A37 N-methylase
MTKICKLSTRFLRRPNALGLTVVAKTEVGSRAL